MPERRVIAAAAAASCLVGLSGCAVVQPYERGWLAAPCMASPFEDTPLVATYQDKVVQTLTAGGLPGAAPGGGCGCTQ